MILTYIEPLPGGIVYMAAYDGKIRLGGATGDITGVDNAGMLDFLDTWYFGLTVRFNEAMYTNNEDDGLSDFIC